MCVCACVRVCKCACVSRFDFHTLAQTSIIHFLFHQCKKPNDTFGVITQTATVPPKKTHQEHHHHHHHHQQQQQQNAQERDFNENQTATIKLQSRGGRGNTREFQHQKFPPLGWHCLEPKHKPAGACACASVHVCLQPCTVCLQFCTHVSTTNMATTITRICLLAKGEGYIASSQRNGRIRWFGISGALAALLWGPQPEREEGRT